MSLQAANNKGLDNLMRIGQIKAEPRNDAEVRRMLAMARYFQVLIRQMAEEAVWERFFKASGLQSACTNGFRGIVRMKTAERENAA